MWRYVLLLLILLLGCTPAKYPQDPVIHAKVEIDSKFTPDEARRITLALDEWQDKTYSIFTWSYKTQDSCQYTIKFNKRSKTEPEIQDKLKHYGPFLRGTSVKYNSDCPKGHIDLIADNIDNDKQYYIVVLHEIGHQLNLGHSNHPHSVMNSGTAEVLSELGDPDIKQFLHQNVKLITFN